MTDNKKPDSSGDAPRPGSDRSSKRKTAYAPMSYVLHNLCVSLQDWQSAEEFAFREIDYAQVATLDTDARFGLTGVRITFPSPADDATMQAFNAELERHRKRHQRLPTHAEFWQKAREEGLTPELARKMRASLPLIIPTRLRSN